MAKLVLIDGEGVAELSDGTHWQIAYDQLPKTQRWLNGVEISVTLQLRGSMWPYALTHQPTGQAVSASALRGQAPRCALKGVAWLAASNPRPT
jgi:hypothetical protein